MQKVLEGLKVRYWLENGELVNKLPPPQFEAGQRVSIFIEQNAPALIEVASPQNLPPESARQHPFMFGEQP